jgi:hypothetical protein
MTNGPVQPYLSPSGFSTKTQGVTVVPYAVRLPRNPTGADREYPVGSVWANTASFQAFILASIVAGVAQWAPCGVSPLGDVQRLTGDVGGTILPTANNINILGDVGSGITVVGDPATSTLSLVYASTFVEGTAITTDGTTFVNLLSIPVPASKTLVFDGRLVGWTSSLGGGAATSLVKMGAFRLAGPNATQVGAEDVTLDKQGALGPNNSTAATQVSASAGNLVLAVRGVAGATVQWKVQGLFTTVGV